MKMHLWLVALLCIVIFGCNGTKQNGVASGIPTLGKSYSSPGANVIPGDKKCSAASTTCEMRITLKVKGPDHEPKVKRVERWEDDTFKEVVQRQNNITDHPISEITGLSQVFFTRSSPDCVYYYYAGDWWYICW